MHLSVYNVIIVGRHSPIETFVLACSLSLSVSLNTDNNFASLVDILFECRLVCVCVSERYANLGTLCVGRISVHWKLRSRAPVVPGFTVRHNALLNGEALCNANMVTNTIEWHLYAIQHRVSLRAQPRPSSRCFVHLKRSESSVSNTFTNRHHHHRFGLPVRCNVQRW